MRIYLLVGHFPPVMDSAARLYSQLAESLSKMGHKVVVFSEHPSKEHPIDSGHDYYKQKKSDKWCNGYEVRRISPLDLLTHIPGGKAMRFFLSGLLYSFKGIFMPKPDIILVYSPPLYMGIAGYVLSLIKNTGFVLNIQDIHPKVLFESGAVNNGILKRILLHMERICYSEAKSFIVYSSGNKKYLQEYGVDKPVHIIPNWVNTKSKFSENETAGMRASKRFIVSYAGTMQNEQGLEIVLNAAELLKDHKDILFLLAGEGSSKKLLQEEIKRKRLYNISLWPVLSYEKYLKFVNESDVCIVTLNKDVPLQTVPGKLAELMSQGKPIVAAVNLNGDAAEVINDARCGICVNPLDSQKFAEAIARLYLDRDLLLKMGENSRSFAEKNFSLEACTKRYEEVLLMNIMKNNE